MRKRNTNGNKPQKPKRQHIIDAFVFLEAINPNNPCTLNQLGLNLELYNTRINYLIKHNIIIPSEEKENNFYLDHEFYLTFKEQEDKLLFIKLVSIIIPGILLILLSLAWLVL